MSDPFLRNPSDPAHLMRLKPWGRRVRVRIGEELLAETTNALLLQELGRDLYDPVFYLPRSDIVAPLGANPATSHCPLKGDAVYFDLLDAAGAVQVEKVAWSYPTPLAFAAELAGRISFYPQQATFEDGPIV